MSAAENKAVFLSYASQDAEAARRICEALRAAGVEVWFDQSELRGGDAWDAKIRKQIKECALFVPVISANTQARLEGYFRLEWRLADQRSHLMAKGKPFLLPVLVDGTRDSDAHVPDSFLEVQWTRLTSDAAIDALGKRVRDLLDGGRAVSGEVTTRTGEAPRPAPRRTRPRWVGPAVAVALGALAAGLWKWRATIDGSPRPSAGAEAQSPARRAVAIVEDEEHYSRSALELAEQFCQQAIARDPNDAEVHAAYARVHAALIFMSLDPTAERRAAAQKEMNLAARLAPEADEVQLARSDFFKLSPATRVETEPILRTLVARRPQHKYTLRQLALTLRARARALGDNNPAAAALYDEAVGLLRRADALPGGDAMALLLLAQHEASQGRGDEAERVLDEGLARQVSPRLLRFKSDLLVARGDLAGAAATVEKLPASNAVEPGFTTALVQIRIWQRRPEDALRLLAACPVDYFEDTFFTGPRDYWTGLALSLQPNRQDAARVAWQQALHTLESRLAKQPGVAHLVRWKGVLLSYVGDPTEARRLLELAEQLEDPLLGINNVRLAATAWLRLGERERALQSIRSWRVAARLSPSTIGWLRFDPELDTLRESAEFRAVLTEIEQRTGFVVRSAAGAGDSAAGAKSVAVLAFENRSSEKDSEYFSDGVSDELINVLGRVTGLKVIARTSSFAFKGNKTASAQEIARALGVAHLVEGSVQQMGGRARVIARLIRADTGEQLWGDSFDPELKDILTAQVTTARAIAEALTLRLNAGARMASLNPDAVKLYLQGRQEWGLRTVESMRRAEDLFTRAIALEPKFARAHSGLVDAWVTLGQQDDSLGLFGERDSVEMRRVIERAHLAVALDPDSAEAQASLGGALGEAWQPAESRRALERALELNPNYATAHQWLGRALLTEGRADEAIASLRRACELDPLSSRMADNRGFGLWLVGRAQEGLVEIDRALRLKSDSEQAAAQRAMVLASLERQDEAVAQAREVLQRGGFRVMHAVYALAIAGQQEEAARAFASLPKTRALSRGAFALAALGRWDECLAALQPATMVTGNAHQMLFHPVFDPIRSDPRFVTALETLGLTEAHARAQAWRAANPPQKVPAKK